MLPHNFTDFSWGVVEKNSTLILCHMFLHVALTLTTTPGFLHDYTHLFVVFLGRFSCKFRPKKLSLCVQCCPACLSLSYGYSSSQLAV